ncbi:unnamed protein product [Lactuca saligna]|uniref:Uncharacterized protein n=1 Tax=Lactuca saligna TaxID=75948 RepID=A0AA35ZGC9_LACSI|nr:unnamed protein product [Lactuca saligna]
MNRVHQIVDTVESVPAVKNSKKLGLTRGSNFFRLERRTFIRVKTRVWKSRSINLHDSLPEHYEINDFPENNFGAITTYYQGSIYPALLHNSVIHNTSLHPLFQLHNQGNQVLRSGTTVNSFHIMELHRVTETIF